MQGKYNGNPNSSVTFPKNFSFYKGKAIAWSGEGMQRCRHRDTRDGHRFHIDRLPGTEPAHSLSVPVARPPCVRDFL